MKKTEQQLANELDAFLTAKLLGQAPPASEDLPHVEANLAAKLVDLAQEAKLDPAFAARLEEKLARSAERAASRQANPKKASRPGRLTFWQEIEMFIRRSFTMKRTIYTLGAMAAVVVLAVFTWTMFQGDDTEPEVPVVADAPTGTVETGEDSAASEEPVESDEPAEATEPSEPAAPTEPGQLAMLPKMDAVQSAETAAAGRGGGGGFAEGAPAEAPMVADSMMIAPDFSQIWADANFVLNATLPLDPTAANVWQRVYLAVELADARRIADQLGFSGPLYTEVFERMVEPMPVDEPGTADATGTTEEGVAPDRPVKGGETEWVPPTVYHAFDGKRRLDIYDTSINYIDLDVMVEYDVEVPNAVQIAEAFMLEHGMLNFPYELRQFEPSGAVMAHRVVNGRVLEDSEAFVQIAPDGRIAYASNHQYFTEMQDLGQYPLITAEAAWQLIQEDVVGNNISFNIVPNYDETDVIDPRVEPGFAPEDMPRYWQRTYSSGSEAHVYIWPMVYEPAEGDGPPRIDSGEYILNGSDEDLRALAGMRGQNLHVWGTFNADGSVLEMTGYESAQDREPLFFEGVIAQRTADGVIITGQAGEIYLLPDAPEDLEDGLKVNVFAWSSRDVGLAYPVLDWQSIDQWFDYSGEPSIMPLPEPLPVEGEWVDPFSFSEVTINEVVIDYQQTYDYSSFDKRSQPPTYIQPVWVFKGVTDTGSDVELRVQAVSPEYLQGQ